VEHAFDHERLDVYRLSIEFGAFAAASLDGLSDPHRRPRDQRLRSSRSIPQNMAEGNGKRVGPDRRRFFEIARGSALEPAATLDVLVAVGVVDEATAFTGKRMIRRIVAMLTKMPPPEG